MDLSSPPSQRWAGAITAVLDRHAFKDSFALAFANHNASMFNKLKPADWKLLGDSVRKHYPEQAEELVSLSKEFYSHGEYVSYEYLAGWVYFHELAHTDLQDAKSYGDISTACTGIIGQASDGSVLFGGNMDQSPEAVRNVTLRITFMAEGKVWMEAVDWYWFTTGVTRVVRKGVASLQENWRHTENPIAAAEVFAQIQQGVMPQVFAFRHALSIDLPSNSSELIALATPSYSSVLQAMIDVPLASPYYVIVTGINAGEGAIIARNNTGAAEALFLKDSADSWFIAQVSSLAVSEDGRSRVIMLPNFAALS
jgi:N-acylethanolamine-hydrolysing acid amidase